MTTITNQGIITSFTNTAQALNDVFTGFTEDSSTVILNVMANDKGGNAKTLWSLDGSGPTGLLAQDLVGVTNFSKFGATIKITSDGKVSYNASTSTYLQSLAAGEFATDTFTYAIQLGNGTFSWATATVQIAGVNDVPTVIGFTSGAVTEDAAVTAGNLTSSGTIRFDDVDLTDGHTTSVVASVGNALGGEFTASVTDTATGVGDGTVAWNYSVANSATQSLGAGQTATETFTVTINDGKGGTISQDITVTITGTNDVPVISGVSTGGVTEDATTPNLTTGGALTISDVDTGQSNFTAQSSTAGSNGHGTFTLAANGAWTYTASNGQSAIQSLGAGITLTDSFTAVSSDGSNNQLVTVTITGTNDVPTIAGVSTAGVTEDATTPNLTTGGALTISDADTGQSNFTAQGSKVGNYGTFTLDAAGNWTYTASNSQSAIQNLNTGQSLTDSFTAVSSDGSNEQVVTVTINGVTDAPSQVVASLPPVFTDGGDQNDNDGLGDPAGTTIGGLSASETETIYGGAGDDTISGNNGSDIIYGGSGNDTVNGNNQADTLYGGSGNDILNGGTQNDAIIGGYGADTITGGNGSDTIRYLDLLDTGDTITGFVSGEDKIDLSAIDANNAVGANQAFAGGGLQGGQFVLANSVTWFQSGSNTVVLADTDGDLATAEFSITLTGVTAGLLSANDFIL